MGNRIKVNRKTLVDFYEKKNLTTYQISEKFGCCQATICKKLKEFNIKSRFPGADRINLSKKELRGLYLNEKLSTRKIEKKLKISRGTIYRKLKEFNIKTRDLATANITNPRKNFSGDLTEKAYLIGFRIGDLGVRKIYPNSKTITVASGSTIQEQIDLIKNLFKNYGVVRIKTTKNGKTNIWVGLNESFDFLLSKKVPNWIEKSKETFFSFLAGFSDAEGHIGINKNMAYYSLGNYDQKILFNIYYKLNLYGIKSRPPYPDKRKGKKNSEGYVYSKNYWQLRVSVKQDLMKLMKELKPFIKHKNRIKDLNIAISNIERRNLNGIKRQEVLHNYGN